jgi:peptidoglycan/xylan/chitin deacetylase (PgdA/CDA1 family)
MYHRVVSPPSDPWGIAVAPENFHDQIRVLSETRKVVPLKTLAVAAARGAGQGMVAITFDDGYADNFVEAYPVLKKFGCPATIFIVPTAIDSERKFWWDELVDLIFEPAAIPFDIKLDIGGNSFVWNEGTVGRRDLSSKDVSKREKLYFALWWLLRQSDRITRENALGQLAQRLGRKSASGSAGRAMTKDQVIEMARSDLITIGAHTLTHPALPTLAPEQQRDEIIQSRRACEDIIGLQVDTFAYPFGEADDRTVKFVREAGYTVACTTVSGAVTAASDPLRLPRRYVANYGGADLRLKLATNFLAPALQAGLSRYRAKVCSLEEVRNEDSDVRPSIEKGSPESRGKTFAS